MNCFILTSGIYYTLYLIYFFAIKPNLYIDEEKEIKLLISRGIYLFFILIGTIPIFNLVIAVFFIVVILVNLFMGSLY